VPDPAEDPTDPKIASERLTQNLNRNRIKFLRTELQTCFTLADMVEAEHGMDNPEHPRDLSHPLSFLLRICLEDSLKHREMIERVSVRLQCRGALLTKHVKPASRLSPPR
jgi:hypothetical protein